jgi:cytochrome c-type biogenesis protein CcmH/NrfG
MNRVLILVTLVVLFACGAVRAQDSADERYVIIYGLIQQADNLASSGEPSRALDSYNESLSELQSFNRVYPDWNHAIVNFRLSYLTSKIDALTATMPATNTVPAIASNVLTAPVAGIIPNNPAVLAANAALSATNAALQTRLQSIQQQVQSVQANNSTLEAKLKEALTLQPTAVDARELEKARNQIRDLMKQNDVLQATVNEQNQNQKTAVPSAAETAALASLQKQLAAANDKLQEEAARSARLELENQTLNARVKQLLASPEAAAALNQENELLKKQLAELKAAPVLPNVPLAVAPPLPASDNPGLNDELASARLTISLLQSNITVTSLEKDALQQRMKQIQAGSAPGLTADKQAAYEAQVKALTEERNALLAKLGDANKEIYGHKKQDVAARVDQLTDEVTTLRARLAVDETQSVPYTDEELALFKQAPPALPGPEAQKKSIKELPAGSAELVAEAQSFFVAKKYEQAEKDYLKILERDQNNGIALANLATIELQQNKLDDAEKHIKLALAQAPNDGYNIGVLGYIQFQQGKYDDALDTLSRAAKLDPRNPQVLNFLAGCYNHKGLRQQAETALRKALQLDPGNAEAHNNLAVIYLSQNPPLVQLARWHYQKALDGGQPHNPELEKTLADRGAPVNQ